MHMGGWGVGGGGGGPHTQWMPQWWRATLNAPEEPLAALAGVAALLADRSKLALPGNLQLSPTASLVETKLMTQVKGVPGLILTGVGVSVSQGVCRPLSTILQKGLVVKECDFWESGS